MRTGFLSVTVLLSALVCGVGFGAPEKPPVSAPAVQPTAGAPRHTPLGNPHLHIPEAPATPHAKPSGAALTQRPWAPRWDARTFFTQQRGLGTVVGVFRNASGQPVSGVRVALRKPGGKLFAHAAMKHITWTNTNGTFVMTNVKPGSYRVFGSLTKKKHGAAQLVVTAGTTGNVTVKI